MRRTTRVSFSDKDGTPVIDVKLPTSWPELSQKELRIVYTLRVLCNGVADSLILKIFRMLTGLRVERQLSGRYLLAFPAGGRKRRCWVTPEQLAELLEPLEFINEPGDVPVRPDWVFSKKFKAVDAQLHGVSFGDYIQIENLYQGIISSGNDEILNEVAKILYPGFKEGKRSNSHELDPVEAFAIMQWLVQVKALFAKSFRNFFRPASGEVDAPSMLEVMNNEIRALTGGDVSKEKEIFEVDCWRALTELDFKAKEAEEYRRMQSKQ